MEIREVKIVSSIDSDSTLCVASAEVVGAVRLHGLKLVRLRQSGQMGVVLHAPSHIVQKPCVDCNQMCNPDWKFCPRCGSRRSELATLASDRRPQYALDRPDWDQLKAAVLQTYDAKRKGA